MDRKYSIKKWLNPENSYAISFISCFDGDVKNNNTINNTKFISISDCSKSIRIYKTEQDTLSDFINKLKIIRDALQDYIEHLEDE